jgi:hypothetical protein
MPGAQPGIFLPPGLRDANGNIDSEWLGGSAGIALQSPTVDQAMLLAVASEEMEATRPAKLLHQRWMLLGHIAMPARALVPPLLTVLVALAGAARAAPRPNPHTFEVILVRHADKSLERVDYNLSAKGFQRALALAQMIPACLGRPSEIITFFLNPLTNKNARSYQSAVPLAVASGVDIAISQASLDDSYGVGEGLRRRAANTGSRQRLVLFWEHRHMPAVARGLGWSGMRPIAEDDFEGLYVFRFRSANAKPEVTLYRQSELFQQPCARQARLPWTDRALPSGGEPQP